MILSENNVANGRAAPLRASRPWGMQGAGGSLRGQEVLVTTALADTVCHLNVLLDLDNLKTRRLTKSGRVARSHFLILARLFHTKTRSLSQAVLADWLQLAPSRVHAVTKELEREGLVDRVRKPGGKVVVVSLTDDGAARLEDDLRAGAGEFRIFEQIWNRPEEIRMARQLIEKAVTRLSEEVLVET